MASKKEMKKLTLNDLLSAKMQKEKDKISFKDIYVNSLGGTLTFKKPSNDDILDTIDQIGDDQSTKVCVEAFKFLIYENCDMLHNDELLKEYEVVEPTEIVDKIFDIADIINTGNELFKMCGLDEIDISEKIKNS